LNEASEINEAEYLCAHLIPLNEMETPPTSPQRILAGQLPDCTNPCSRQLIFFNMHETKQDYDTNDQFKTKYLPAMYTRPNDCSVGQGVPVEAYECFILLNA